MTNFTLADFFKFKQKSYGNNKNLTKGNVVLQELSS